MPFGNSKQIHIVFLPDSSNRIFEKKCILPSTERRLVYFENWLIDIETVRAKLTWLAACFHSD